MFENQQEVCFIKSFLFVLNARWPINYQFWQRRKEKHENNEKKEKLKYFNLKWNGEIRRRQQNNWSNFLTITKGSTRRGGLEICAGKRDITMKLEIEIEGCWSKQTYIALE